MPAKSTRKREIATAAQQPNGLYSYCNPNALITDLTIDGLLDIIHTRAGVTEIVYVWDLRVMGECILAHCAKTGGIAQLEQKAALRPYIGYVGPRYRMHLSASPIAWYQIDLHDGRKQATYRDWLNIIPISESELMQSYPSDNVAKSMLAAITDLQQYVDVDHYKTIGAAAMAAYKASLGKNAKKLYDSRFPKIKDDKLRRMLRYAYNGPICHAREDRVRVHLGNDWGRKSMHGKDYDCNGMYPHIMSAKYMPFGLPKELDLELASAVVKYYVAGDPEDMLRILRPRTLDQCIAWLESWTPIIICNLHATSKPGHLPCIKWPEFVREYRRTPIVDMPWTTLADGSKAPAALDIALTLPDIRNLAKHYNVNEISVVGGADFSSSKDMFRDFFGKYYQIKIDGKKEGNIGKTIAGKLLCNNLSGKFGARLTYTSISYAGYNPDYGVLYSSHKSDVMSGYSPVAAYITAYCREIMADVISDNWEHYIYTDTDGAAFDCDLDDYFRSHGGIGGAMGEWKVESEFTEFYVHELKTYAFLRNDESICVKASGVAEHLRDIILDYSDEKAGMMPCRSGCGNYDMRMLVRKMSSCVPFSGDVKYVRTPDGLAKTYSGTYRFNASGDYVKSAAERYFEEGDYCSLIDSPEDM